MRMHRGDSYDDELRWVLTDRYACARAWSALSSAHALVTERLTDALMARAGLAISEFEVLLSLHASGAPGVRPGNLTGVTRLSQPAVSRLIDRLVQQGLVHRLADPDDRRAVLVALTDAGADALRRAIPVHAETITDCLISRLTASEHEVLTATLDRIASP
jgi:DNA-binding MarR family transcriptional regulator